MTAQIDRDIIRYGQQLTIEDASGDRLDRLILEAHGIINQAFSLCASYEVTAVAALFSGGNDSTVLAHFARDLVTHYIHANTQVGAEPTRQFVRDTASGWDVPLLEHTPPPNAHSYENLVLRKARAVAPRAKYEHIYQGGFPGARDHGLMFGHLKEKTINAIRVSMCPQPRRQRMIFLDGVRKSESAGRLRRAGTGELKPIMIRGSEVRVMPFFNWTKLDLNAYRKRFPTCPRNSVADWLHMSMECACGCYAKAGEIDWIRAPLPSLADYLEDLQARVRREAQLQDWDINPQRLTWGWQNSGECVNGCNI